MRRQGVALPTVLGLIAFLLTIGLAIGTVSTLALNMSRQEYVDVRATMLARSALTRTVTELEGESGGGALSAATVEPEDLLQGINLVEEMDSTDRVTVTFDRSQPAYSSDNSASDLPLAGWTDRGTNRTSIPPYTLELILRVETQGAERLFRVFLRRVWPYAVYVRSGPLVIAGTPNGPASRVEGDVFATWRHDAAGGGLHDPGNGPGLAQREYLAGWYPVEIDAPVTVGPQLLRYEPPTRQELERDGTRVLSSLVVGAGPGGRLGDRSNRLEGDIRYHDSADRELAPHIGPGNEHVGEVEARSPVEPDPLLSIQLPDPSDYTPVSLPFSLASGPTLLADATGAYPVGGPFTRTRGGRSDPPAEVHLLTDVVNLSPQTNSTGGDTDTHYRVGSLAGKVHLTNRGVWPLDETLATLLAGLGYTVPWEGFLVEESAAGIDLRDCTLVVDGDLDLGAYDSSLLTSLSGDNATLIVTGTLVVAGGELNARDRGMVIYANDLILKAGGEYRGLLVGANSVTILPRDDQTLTIRGGILCGSGGLLLRSAEVVHDPRYLKSLQGAGDYEVTYWARLSN